MKKTSLICLILTILMVLSSCRPIYEDIPEPTKDPNETKAVEVDTSSEYFTTGSVNGMGNYTNGYYYNGSWIYIETQGGVTPYLDANGNKFFVNTKVKRIVKYNPYTGTVSSPCLDPSCTHSPGSQCVMLINEYLGGSMLPICTERGCDHSPDSGCIMNNKKEVETEIKRSSLSSYAIYGDWLFKVMAIEYTNFGRVKEITMYNLQTGEVINEFAPDIGDMIMTTWDGNSYADGKLYKIKQVLDYTDTGYVPGGDKKAIDFTPKTVSTLCEYDLETQKITELFEIPSNYGLQTISNKRFYFAGLDDDYYYSCTRDGKDFRREDVRTIRTDESIGTYVYEYSDSCVKRYDLTTNTQIDLKVDFSCSSKPIVTNIGILYSTYTVIDEVIRMVESGPSEEQTDDEWADELEKLMYSGTAQIWSTDYDGNNLKLIFEKENSQISIMFADVKFAYVYYKTAPNDSNYNFARNVINLETGEIMKVPYLEMLDPPGYVSNEDKR